MGALGAWVPALLPEARARGDGYRVTSKDLGRDLQEDLSIKPDGIKDFGLADMGDARGGKRTAVDLVLEYGSRVGVAKPAEALRWLAGVLGVVVSRPQLRRVPAPHAPHGDGRGDEPMQDGDPSPEPPPDDALADAGSAAGASAAPSPLGGKIAPPRAARRARPTMLPMRPARRAVMTTTKRHRLQAAARARSCRARPGSWWMRCASASPWSTAVTRPGTGPS